MTDSSAPKMLDSREMIEALDVSGVLKSIEMLGDQVQHIWEIAQGLHIDESYKDISSVVVAGMGGSALGTHVIQTLFREIVKVPILIAPDYTVPHFVNEHTLVIASSYSGTTEETIAATEDAFKKGAKVAGITSGGKLAELLKAHNAPALVFEPKYNPCNQPRMALGYSIFGQIALFARAGVLSVTEEDYKAVLAAIADAHLQYSVAITQEKNLAKILAFEMKERIPVIVTAEHLEGAGHVFANQLNENAKNYSEFRVIPELNHHLMEGLQFPKLNDSTLVFVMVDSPLYSASNRRRLELTEQVLDKNHIAFQRITLKGKTKLEQTFELLTFGAYANFYLAMLNNINPAPIPWVDWFKSQLKK